MFYIESTVEKIYTVLVLLRTIFNYSRKSVIDNLVYTGNGRQKKIGIWLRKKEGELINNDGIGKPFYLIFILWVSHNRSGALVAISRLHILH
jgi:hypothetical protein